MRVWFLKETKSFCTSCATGCNTLIGSARRRHPSPDPARERRGELVLDVRLRPAQFRLPAKRTPLARAAHPRAQTSCSPATWNDAIEHAAAQLKPFVGWQIAILASGRMTNEELWLTCRLAQVVRRDAASILSRGPVPGDDILLSEDRNPNTNGARLLGVASDSGACLTTDQGSDRLRPDQGAHFVRRKSAPPRNHGRASGNLPVYVVMDMLSNEATGLASAVLPSFGFAEKRGSMINGKGRLQRLNRAVRAPGQARDDWEILRDLMQAMYRRQRHLHDRGCLPADERNGSRTSPA